MGIQTNLRVELRILAILFVRFLNSIIDVIFVIGNLWRLRLGGRMVGRGRKERTEGEGK